MKSLLTKSILLVIAFSQLALAQAQTNITEGVNFFRRSNSMVPISARIAMGKSGSSLGIYLGIDKNQSTNSVFIKFTEVANGGLTYKAQIQLYNSRYDEGPSFFGEVNLTSCVRENGQNIFGEFKSLEEVLRYSHESANSTQFSSCLFTGKALFADYVTPDGTQPRPTMEDVTVAIFSDRVQISGLIKGVQDKPYNFKSPFMYYYNDESSVSLQEARRATLDVLQGALATLQGEIGNKQLPKTVAYIMENRQTLQEVLKTVQDKKLNAYELIEFSVSVKNAFHILDQAVGLASDRKIQMRDLIQISK